AESTEGGGESDSGGELPEDIFFTEREPIKTVQMTASSDTGPTTIVDTLASYSVGDHVEVEV
ncbi:hypothetical protein KEM48_010234, partial [Puccinia striiformis f. sp. tritici PST-130]